MAQSSRSSASNQSAHQLRKKLDLHLDYLLYLPPGYEGQTSWPLLLFLNGSYMRVTDLALLKATGLPMLL